MKNLFLMHMCMILLENHAKLCLVREVGEYIFSRTFLKTISLHGVIQYFLFSISFRPVLHLPCPSKATLAVRFCPVLFELRSIPKEKPKKPGKSLLSDTHRKELCVIITIT